MFCDTHCHILSEYYEDIESVLKEAKEAGVSRVINAAYNLESCKEVMALVKKYPEMYGVVGLHPENISEDFDYTIFDNLDKKIVGIGEIGLDYHYTKDNKDKQIEIFEHQLNIAEKLNLPVVIHSREAAGDTLMAKEYIKLGFVLGVNGVITFKNCNLSDTLKNIDINSIILETDSPYLTPVPFRGTQNNPAKMMNTAKFVADIYGVSLSELAKITNQNIKRIFDI